VKSMGGFLGHAPYADIPWDSKFNQGRVAIQNNVALLALVRRVSDTPLKWPTQKRYQT
jgi:hypothetical protein